MLHSKSDEDLGKAEEVTKQVEFESSKIINIKRFSYDKSMEGRIMGV